MQAGLINILLEIDFTFILGMYFVLLIYALTFSLCVCVCFPCLEAFAVVREAAKRTIGMRHFDVQVCLYIYSQILVHAISWVHFYNLEERLLSILLFSFVASDNWWRSAS